MVCGLCNRFVKDGSHQNDPHHVQRQTSCAAGGDFSFYTGSATRRLGGPIQFLNAAGAAFLLQHGVVPPDPPRDQLQCVLITVHPAEDTAGGPSFSFTKMNGDYVGHSVRERLVKDIVVFTRQNMNLADHEVVDTWIYKN